MKTETELTTMKNWGTATHGKSVSCPPTIHLSLCNGDSWFTLQSQRVHQELTGQDLTILINNRYRCTTHAIPNSACIQQL